MRKLLVALLMLFSSMSCWAFETPPTQTLAQAIARAEGFYQKGTKPNRLHNPGDIRAPKGARYPGQIGRDRQGYAIFKNDRAGFAALESLIERIIAGESRFYTVNSTLRELARKYATSPTWVRNVAKNLGVDPRTPLWEILDVAPALTVRQQTDRTSGATFSRSELNERRITHAAQGAPDNSGPLQ